VLHEPHIRGGLTGLREALDDGPQRVAGGHHVDALPVLTVGAVRRLLVLLVHCRLLCHEDGLTHDSSSSSSRSRPRA